MPWLNRVNREWLEGVVGGCRAIFSLDNHFSSGGLGDSLLNELIASEKLRNKQYRKIAIDDYPVWGTPQEVLKYHGVDGESLVERILSINL